MSRIALGILFAVVLGAQEFPIAGTVVDAGSLRPMPLVRLLVYPYGKSALMQSVVTGEDGRFQFRVPKGKYSLVGEYRDFRQPYGQSGPGAGFGISLFTGPDLDTSRLVFRWFAAGAISGKIMDPRGEPAENVLVQLIRSSVTQGRRRTATAAWTYTNDLGEYRFGGLLGGMYFLAATGRPWTETAGARGPMRGTSQEVSRAYIPLYYPNATDLSGAGPVILSPGGEAKADFALTEVSGVNLTVKCADQLARGGMLSLVADGIEGVESFQVREYFSGDSQIIRGVPPGRYVLRVARTGDKPFAAEKDIAVGATDLTVEIAPHAPQSLSGTVTLSPSGAKPRGTLISRLINQRTGAAWARTVGADGSFRFDGIPAGNFRIYLASPDGFYAKSRTCEGISCKDDVLEIGDGVEAKVELRGQNDVGRLTGLVKEADTPIAGALVVLAPSKLSNDPLSYRAFQTDSDGSYDLMNVPAGEYLLFAVAQLDFEFAEPSAIRPYVQRAKLVEVKAKETASHFISIAAMPNTAANQ